MSGSAESPKPNRAGDAFAPHGPAEANCRDHRNGYHGRAKDNICERAATRDGPTRLAEFHDWYQCHHNWLRKLAHRDSCYAEAEVMEPFDGEPVVAPSGDGRLELFVFGRQDGRLWHAWQGQWSNSSDWIGWSDLGGPPGAWPATVAANGDGTLTLAVGNEFSQLSYASQTAWSNGWSAWTLLDPQAPPPLTTTVPDLIDLSVALAQQQVQAAQLHMTTHGSGNWVGNQSPAGGTVVPVGSNISVGLVANPP